jgi:hypothetical protein
LIRFLKYRLGTPFLKELPIFDNSFVPLHWTDQVGKVLHKGPYIYTVERTPGSRGELGIAKLTPDSISILEQTLTEPIKILLYEELLSDARTAVFEDNLRRAVLEMAIACEIAVKNRFFTGGSAAGAAFEYLEDKSQIRTTVLSLIDGVAVEAFNRSFKKDHLKEYESIDCLFRCRNKVAHRGELSYRDDKGKKIAVTIETITKWWDAVDALFFWLKELAER